jgi:hypothetical protein
MKGIVADLVVGTHGENGLPGRLECSTIDFAVCGARDIACVNSIRSFVCQTRRELLPDDLCDRGSVTREARKARAQRAFTRRAHFVATKAAPVAQLQTERFLFLEQLKSLLQPAPVSQVKFQQRYQMRNRILSKAVPAWAIVP